MQPKQEQPQTTPPPPPPENVYGWRFMFELFMTIFGWVSAAVSVYLWHSRKTTKYMTYWEFVSDINFYIPASCSLLSTIAWYISYRLSSSPNTALGRAIIYYRQQQEDRERQRQQ